MAVVKDISNTKLVLRVENGTSATGAVLYKSVNFTTIKETATDEAIFNCGTGLGSLMATAPSEIRRVDTAVLSEE